MRHARLIGPRGAVFETMIPTSRAERMRGLLGRDPLARGEALLLERTRSVHTIGMRFELAVVLLDRGLHVIEVRRSNPWRFVLPRARVRHVLECAVDADIRQGDRLRVVI